MGDRLKLPSNVEKVMSTAKQEGATAVAVKAARRFQYTVDVARATRRMRREARRERTLDDAIAFAFRFAVGEVTIGPTQFRVEIAGLLELLARERPRTLLEIGTANGGTLYLLSRVARPDARLASIDLPGGEFGGGYERLRIPLLRSLRREGQSLHLMRQDSHDPQTLTDVQLWLAGESLDFLFIDGDHSFEGVERDLEMYGPLVRAGGIIAFHDIVPGTEERVGGVPQFWNQAKDGHETEEFVKDWDQGGLGIGVIRVPEGARFERPAPRSSGLGTPT